MTHASWFCPIPKVHDGYEALLGDLHAHVVESQDLEVIAAVASRHMLQVNRWVFLHLPSSRSFRANNYSTVS